MKGIANPSGKLTMTFPVNYMDVASSANFPYNYQFDMRAAFAGFMNQEETKKELVRNVDYTHYEEDIYVGYRYFGPFEKSVSYPFGYGLSYTDFEYSNAQISEKNGIFTFSVDVRNTGNVAGKEVVQLYVSAPANAQLPKPEKELKAFAKTRNLKPGEIQTISMTVKTEDLASYNENTTAWVTDAGEYKFIAGSSSTDVKATLNGKITKKLEVKTHDVLKLKVPM